MAYLRAHCVEAESRMAKLSDRAMAASDDVFARLAGYVRAHKTEFGLA